MEHVEFSLNAQQVDALLEFWPGAVRVVDAYGHTLAQNQQALNHAALKLALAQLAHEHGSSTLQGISTQADLANEPGRVLGFDLGAGLRLEMLEPATEETSEISFPVAPTECAKPIERRALPRATERPIEIQVLSRGITHELRNPLAAILTAVSLVQDDPGMSEETLMLLGVVRKESMRMNRILTEFSAYVKPRPPQPKSFDLASAVRTVMNQMDRGTLEDAGIAIEDALPDALPAFADEEHIQQVLDHVLHNAIEAMPGGGRLRLETQSLQEAHGADDESAAKVLLVVSDNGSGFSGEGLERAFQPFFSSKSQSTGLGLSIARSAVEASGGRIWIENVDGQSALTSPMGRHTLPSEHSIASIPTSRRSSSPQQHGARVHIELPSTPASAS